MEVFVLNGREVAELPGVGALAPTLFYASEFDNFSKKKASVLITANIIVTNFALTAFRTDILFFPSSTFLS